MDYIKFVAVSVVVSVVVAFGVFQTFKTSPTEVPIPQDTLGATPGNSVEGSYFTIGGVDFAHVKTSWIATTSRVCIIKNPFPNATSSLVAFTARNTNTINGANTFDVGTTTHANGYGATSTPKILQGFVIANLKMTGTDGETGNKLPVLIDKRESINMTRYATGTAGTDNYTGVCQATFMKL